MSDESTIIYEHADPRHAARLSVQVQRYVSGQIGIVQGDPRKEQPDDVVLLDGNTAMNMAEAILKASGRPV